MKGFNENLINEGDTVGVALSGGEDSVCLLYLLKELCLKKNFKVVAVNVEHGIRGSSSVKDSEFCVELCKKLGVALKSYSVDALKYSAENKTTVEEGARFLRYSCFFDAVKSGFCNKIATAHHRDDDEETILLNLFRGATVSGLKGMDEVAYDGVIIRPMLGVKKSDINDYIEKNGIAFVSDETNSDVNYTRNYIRRKVVPAVKERFPSFGNALKRLSFSARSDDGFLYSMAKETVEYKNGCAYIKCGKPYPVFSRAVILALKYMGVTKDFDNRHIDALFKLSGNIGGKKADLLNGLYAVKEGDYIVVKRKRETNAEDEEPFTSGVTELERGKVVVERCDITGEYKNFRKDGRLFLDYDKIPEGAVIRTRRRGDVFTKFGGGTVSLKKFLTDKKIPAEKKDEVYVVAKDDTVYAVLGIEISSGVKIDETTVSPVKITFIKKEQE